MGIQIMFSLLLQRNICGGYSLEAPNREVPHQGTSSKYPKHMFLWRNKKNISTSWIRKLEMCQYDTDAPAQGPSSPAHRHFAKNEVEKGP